MSLGKQRIVNSFPSWSRVRNDPASFGHRYLGAFGEILDDENRDAYLASQLPMLHKPWLGPIEIYSFDYTDEYNSYLSEGFVKYERPSLWLIGQEGGNWYSLDQVETIEEVLSAPTNRIKMVDSVDGYGGNPLFISADPELIGSPQVPERVCFHVHGASDFALANVSNGEVSSGRHFIKVTGYDINYNFVIEEIAVDGNGFFFSKHIYTSMESVEIIGFTAEVEGYANQPYMLNRDEKLLYPFLSVANDRNIGACYLKVTAGEGKTILSGYVRTQKPSETINGRSTYDPDELAFETYLKDPEGLHIEAFDWCIDYETGSLLVLTYDLILGFDLSIESMSSNIPDSSDIYYVSLETLTPYPLIGENLPVYTRFKKPRYNIQSVVIGVTTPSESVIYLQLDGSWSETPYEHKYNPDAETPDGSWRDFKFVLPIEDEGEYIFNVATRCGGETTNFYTAVKTIGINAFFDSQHNLTNIGEIYYRWDDTIAVRGEAELVLFEKRKDVAYVNLSEKRVYLSDNYSQLEID